MTNLKSNGPSQKLLSLLEDKTKRIAACERHIWLFSLYYFTRFHFFTMPPLHKEMYSDLEGMNTGQVIGAVWKMWRESAKTTLAKIKIIHNICYKKKFFNIWASFDQAKAEANLFDIVLELQTNGRLINDFGQLFFSGRTGKEKPSEKKSIKEFITTNGVKVKAYSTGQSIRGEVFGAYRPDFVILDDIETMKTIVSEARTKQVVDFVDELLSGMGGDCNVLVLANSLSYIGSVVYLEEKVRGMTGWVIKDVPVISEENVINWADKYVMTDVEATATNATILNPKEHKISLETKRRLLGEFVYNREMLNRPLTEEEREFKLKWLQKTYVDEDLAGKVLNTYAVFDIANSKGRKESQQRGQPDFTGIIVVSIDTYNNWYVRYVKRERINAPEKIERIFWIWQAFRGEHHLNQELIKIGVEKVAFEDEILPYIKIKSEEQKVYPVVEELKHGGTQKEQRIRGALQGRFQHGKVFFQKQPVDDTDKLKLELYDFPKSKFDDLMDALAYIEQIGVPPYAAKNEMGHEMTDVEKEFFELKNKDKKKLADRVRNL